MACLDEREGKLGACFWTGFLRVFAPWVSTVGHGLALMSEVTLCPVCSL